MYEYKVLTQSGSDEYVTDQLNAIAAQGYRLHKIVQSTTKSAPKYIFERSTERIWQNNHDTTAQVVTAQG